MVEYAIVHIQIDRKGTLPENPRKGFRAKMPLAAF